MRQNLRDLNFPSCNVLRLHTVRLYKQVELWWHLLCPSMRRWHTLNVLRYFYFLSFSLISCRAHYNRCGKTSFPLCNLVVSLQDDYESWAIAGPLHRLARTFPVQQLPVPWRGYCTGCSRPHLPSQAPCWFTCLVLSCINALCIGSELTWMTTAIPFATLSAYAAWDGAKSTDPPIKINCVLLQVFSCGISGWTLPVSEQEVTIAAW